MAAHWALLTGATGFIGKSVLKRLLCDSIEWMVIIIIRPKLLTRTTSGKRIRRTKHSRPTTSETRMKTLVASLGLSKEQANRVYYIESHIDASTDSDVLYEAIEKEMSRHGSPPLRLDLVIHMAASLQQDCDDMPLEKVERIRQRNQDVNVRGLRTVLAAIERFGTPDKVRVLRPSIVCGADSNTGLMASLRYFDSRWKRILGKMFFCLQKSVPFIGNEHAIIDVIDIQDTAGAIMDLVHLDCCPRGPAGTYHPHKKGSGLGSVYYMSTAYVHGKRKGLLMEEPVYTKPDQKYNNSYEETKAKAENIVDAWAARLSGSQTMCTYHHITNENSPTLGEIVSIVHAHYNISPWYTSKIQFCSDMDAFEVALKGIRPRMAQKYLAKYFRHIRVLTPYLLRDSSAAFDCSITRSILGRSIAKNVSTDYFLSTV